MNMESLGGGYKRRDNTVYFSGARISKADHASFAYLGGSWARDAERVYDCGSVLRSADYGSFAVLSSVFAKDARTVFYVGGSVKEADAASFVALDSGCHFSSPGAYPVSYCGYGRDRAHIFHHVETIGKPGVVRKADHASFRSLEGVYGLDDHAAFIDRRQIKGANPRTWFSMQGLYSRDDQRVYYDNLVLKGADVESFICLWGDHGTWAKDKNRYYDVGRPATQDQYLEVLASEAEHLESLKEALLAGRL